MQRQKFPEFLKYVKLPDANVRLLNYLIVVPRLTEFNDQQYLFPVGTGYISAALKETGRNVYCLNMNYKDDTLYALLHKNIIENNIDVVLAGGLSAQYTLLKEIFDTARQIKPDVITIVGGGIISGDPLPAMEALETADYGVIGEGEFTVCNLAYAIETGSDVSLLPNIVYERGQDSWIVTSERTDIENLDILPWPDYEGLEYGKILDKIPPELWASSQSERLGAMNTGRSCPFNCTFCFHPSGAKYRKRSLNSVFSELDYLIDHYNINAVYFVDELMFSDHKVAAEFCKRIKPYNIRIQCSLRVNNITEDFIIMLKQSGISQVGLGLESADNRILKSMRKHTTVEEIENALDICVKAGMVVQGAFIFGDLEETFETATNTLDWLDAHPAYPRNMGWIATYPGSYLYKIAYERGIIKDKVQYLKDGKYYINVSKMTAEERQKIAERLLRPLAHGDLLKSATIEFSPSVGKFTLEGECPVCGTRSVFQGVDAYRAKRQDECHDCHKIFNLTALDYVDTKKFTHNVEKASIGHKIAVWPIVSGISKVFDAAPTFYENDDIYFVDSDSNKHGVMINGKPVCSPGIIEEKQIDIVIIPVTYSVVKPIKDTIVQKYPSIMKILFLGELMV